MSTTLTAQTVAIILPQVGSTITEQQILNDSGVQSAQGFSLGGDMIVGYLQYYNHTIGTLNPQSAYTLRFFVTAANAATIVSGIAALKSRLQAIDPTVVDVVTWGETIAFN